jgi:hypothetical protein
MAYLCAVICLALTNPLLAEAPASAITLTPRQLQLPASTENRAFCTLAKHNGIESFYSDRYVKGTRTVTLFDPTACERASYPFEIVNMKFTLFDVGNRPWPLKMQVVIYGVYADPCFGPGPEIYRFPIRCDSADFKDPHIGTAWLPVPQCVSGPFFMGLEYDDDKTGPYPSITLDFTTAPACDNWQYYNNQWVQWANYWNPPVPGYPLFWVTGQPGSTVNCAPDSSRMKINEISTFATDFGSGTWHPAAVELYNSGGIPLNVNGWQLARKDGSAIATLPNWTIPAKSYLTIKFSKGTNDADLSDRKGTFFTQGDSIGVFDADGDELGLYKGTISQNKIVDFVAWSRTGSFTGGTPYSQALAKGIWRSGNFVNTANYGFFSSMGLTVSGFDHDGASDWHEFDWATYFSAGYPCIGNPVQSLPPNGGSIGQGAQLEWNAVYGAVGYYLEVDQDSLFGNPVIAANTVNPYYSVSGLPEAVYYWRVRVLDSFRMLPENEVWSFYLYPSGGTQPDSSYIGVTKALQHKDTKLLCITDDNGYAPACKRPGCTEIAGANGPWNAGHPATYAHISHCEHCSRYSSRAAIAMINDHYKGSLTQDHISFFACEHVHPGAPEGDLGHQRPLFWSPTDEILSTLQWALNSTGVTSTAGKPIWATVQTEITTNHSPLLICTPGQAMVIDGQRTVKGVKQVHLVDPWPSRTIADMGARNGWWDYGTIEVVRYYRFPTGTVNGLTEFPSVSSDLDHDGIMDFDEGLGPPDYPADRPRKFQCKVRFADSDSDQVNDIDEIRNYTFHDQPGYHPGHENDALGFADIDGDGLRAEHDCDSDNDGLFDGGEDINGNGRNPEAGETCQFDNASGTITLRTNKNVYTVGEAVYLVDWPGVRESGPFHASSTYNAEQGNSCPSKHDGESLTHNRSFHTDADGRAVTTVVDTCPYVGVFYLCADVLDDHTYSSPDNLDPTTCWGCVADTTYGWHFGYDFPYNHPSEPWPPYSYPAACVDDGATKTYSTIEVPWWWHSHTWPPAGEKYWLGIGVPKSLVTSGLMIVDSLPAFALGGAQCAGTQIKRFAVDAQVRNDLILHATDTSVYWYGFSVANWAITDSIMTTRLKITIDKNHFDSLAASAFIQIKAGDSLYGWSSTYYDQVKIRPQYLAGDANGDGSIDISDVVFLIGYIFSGGSAPVPLAAADANCDLYVDISDAVYLISYIFSGGAPPCAGFR